jgi:hypothetical protein
MRRLRILAAMLGCLAAIVADLPAVAAVSAPVPQADLSMSAGAAPCEHCQGCGATQCPKAVDCMAPCAISLPPLGVAAIELPLAEFGPPVWPAHLAVLDGELRPPDPFPPRL